MFGYIRPFKPYMRFCEFQVYNAFYCGLCKNLGKNYGQLYRLLLSYDFAFLGLLCCSFDDEPLRFEPQHCVIHPVRKKLCLTDLKRLDFASAAAVISVYQKLCDSIADTSLIKSLPYRIVRAAASSGYRKAVRMYPETAEKIQKEMDRQFRLEKEDCASLDLACEPTGRIMSELAAQIPGDDGLKEVFGGFGYHLGRFVYLADAYDDAEKDLKRHSYNVLLKYKGDTGGARELARSNINMSLSMIAEYYSKMETKRFREIIDNVIFLGLKSFMEPKKSRKDRGMTL